MDNAQMIAGRYLRWAMARRKYNAIQREFRSGNCIIVRSCTKNIKLQPKHSGMIKATRSGLYMQNGKRWLCIDGCQLHVSKGAK